MQQCWGLAPAAEEFVQSWPTEILGLCSSQELGLAVHNSADRYNFAELCVRGRSCGRWREKLRYTESAARAKDSRLGLNKLSAVDLKTELGVVYWDLSWKIGWKSGKQKAFCSSQGQKNQIFMIFILLNVLWKDVFLCWTVYRSASFSVS